MKPTVLAPGSEQTREPALKNHDPCKVVLADGSVVEGYFNPQRAQYFYFRIGDGWRKAATARFIDPTTGIARFIPRKRGRSVYPEFSAR